VKSYALDRTYAGGEDYTVEGRTLRLPEKSAIPFLRHDELYHNVPGREPGAMKAADGGFLAFSETAFFNDRQLAVTYEHAGTWDGPVPQPARDRLPRTFAKLEKSEPLKIAVFGDSISFGASASGAAARPPWMPRWSDLLADTLTRATGSRIDCINASLGGTRSDWGKRTAAGLVAHESPDLTILGFGMNDGSAKVPPEAFAGNLRAIMDTVRERNPNAEFLLLMSFQPNPKWRPLEPMPAYLETMKGMEGPGVALADLWTMHGHLLRHKDYADMTGNHVNHPNDFLARVYAQVTLATLGVEEPFR
jgi:lysophospholipase L1-like esterase